MAIGAPQEPAGGDAPLAQEEVRAVYDSLAPVYDIWAALTEARASRRALELARVRDGESVLEVAVGTGRMFRKIVRRNPSGTNLGVDLSDGMLGKARRRMARGGESRYELRAGSALSLPVDDGSVDLLVNCYMFDLLSTADMDRALEEFVRVLRPAGRLVLVNMTEGRSWGSRLYGGVSRRSPRRLGGCRAVRLAGRLRQHGFRIDHREYVQQCFFPSEVIAAYSTASS